jgi:hypothetical protein
MAYTKLFSSIVTSTIWVETDRTRIVWITMLALADRNGEVQASIPGLARIAGVPVPDCEDALQKFMSPDPYSRTPDDEGRRIEKIDGGWALINHSKYREMASREDSKEANAKRQKRHYDRKARNLTHTNANLTHTDANLTHTLHIAEAEAEAELREEKKEPSPKKPRKPKPPAQTDEDWLASLCASPENQGVDVRFEYQRMHAWCAKKNQTPSRRRFSKWLERADRPLAKPVQDLSVPNLPESGRSMFDLSKTGGVFDPTYPYHLT